MLNKYTAILSFSLIVFNLGLHAQKHSIQISSTSIAPSANGYIPNESHLYIEDNHQDIEFWKTFSQMKGELEIRFPEGVSFSFTPYPSYTMHPDLQRSFPEIIVGKAVDRSQAAFIYYDYNPYTGFRAIIIHKGERWFIDPIVPEASSMRSVYQRKHLSVAKQAWTCSVSDELVGTFEPENIENTNIFVDKKMHKYRLAVSTTGEYTQFHGGTVNSALAAIVTTVNRVNSVYEIDAAITLELIPNNNLIIFTNPNTDPYNNSSANQMIGVVQGVINNAIGSANYDIGHAFSTGAGGLAQLSSVCGQSKARGITGRAAPTNDPFDIDYVAHEIGHQFGARHTQNNSCNRSAQAAYEPFSASTIMGYAGICAPNLQSNSDDHFHTHSLQEITNFAFRGSGRFCAAEINTGNEAPIINTTLASQFMPILTPFYLSAEVNDPENDSMTFVWEQYDLGSSVQSTTNDQGPVYRSFSPQASSTQYFPRIQTVANNMNFLGERLIFAPRTLNFRLTVRDNNPQGSAVSFSQVSFQAVGNQPFEITGPVQGSLLFSRALNVITWDPGNTRDNPINCQQVRILLSTDNGQSFPHDLGVYPNQGAALVYLPGRIPIGSSNRILIKAEDGIFYQVSRLFSILNQGLSTLEENEELGLVVYPNPTTKAVNVKGCTSDQRIELMDVNGRIVIHTRANNDQTELEVDHLSKGIYMLRVFDKSSKVIFSQRLIKN